jgi:hypothetical protein
MSRKKKEKKKSKKKKEKKLSATPKQLSKELWTFSPDLGVEGCKDFVRKKALGRVLSVEVSSVWVDPCVVVRGA